MLPLERRNEIINIIKSVKSSSITDLAKKLYAGEATIRRDLALLQQQGLIKRTYGGAVWLEGIRQEIPLYVRESEQKNSKNLIGKRAVLMVNEGNTIIMDSSSTTYTMVKYLNGTQNLTVITNGAKTAISLGEDSHVDVYSTGGRLRRNSLSYTGDIAKAFIENIQADILFFSCRAISLENGLFDSDPSEAELRKVMQKNAKINVLLCDSNKFIMTAFYKICDIDKIDYIITDKVFNEDEIRLAERADITIMNVL